MQNNTKQIKVEVNKAISAGKREREAERVSEIGVTWLRAVRIFLYSDCSLLV